LNYYFNLFLPRVEVEVEVEVEEGTLLFIGAEL
jgi:hypothetical protein